MKLSVVGAVLFSVMVSGAAEPVKVFILAGQSNMEGHGRIGIDPRRPNGGKGSLEFLVKDAAAAARFKHLANPDGSWKARDDVWITYLDRSGPLKAGFGVSTNSIGPELGIGMVLGDALTAPVLLIKCAWGGKSLAVDFRPPSSGTAPYPNVKPESVGHYYRETVRLTKEALARVKELVPGSDGKYVLAGFGWHQGWNDRVNEAFNKEYEANMVNFIRDIRKDLGSANLPFVIGETGMGGMEEAHPRALSLMKAQAAAADRPEFKGNVAFVGTRQFWRSTEDSPSSQNYHWNSNAETYYLIGDAMGHALVKLQSP